MEIITRNNFTYYFVNHNKIIVYDEIIEWLESNNPIYFRLHSSLLSKDYTGIIKVCYNDKIILQIKIYEGYYIKICDYKNNITYYIEDSKIPLEIREYNDFAKIDVRYIYDKYIIKSNNDNTIDILYKDTMDEKDDFDLRNVLIDKLSEHEKNIFNKFSQIIKESKLKICSYIDSMDVL